MLNRIKELEAQLTVAEMQIDKLQSSDKLEYSYDDYYTQGGQSVSKMSVDNCHDLMNLTDELTLVGHVQFKAGLVFNELDSKFSITMAGDKIRLIPDSNGKISFMLGRQYVSGVHKLILLKEIMLRSELISVKESNGWDMYLIKYNKYTYTIGFMTTEKGTVSFMKDYSEYKYTPEGKDYYKQYRKQKPTDIFITRKWELSANEDMYGWKNSNNMAEFQEDQLRYSMDMALDAGRISFDTYREVFAD